MTRENRRYKLTFLIDNKESLVIEYPFKVTFDATEKLDNIKGGLNELNLNIYNLSPQNRLKLVVDEEEDVKPKEGEKTASPEEQNQAILNQRSQGQLSDKQKRLRVVFEAGYENDLRVIFQGTVYSGEIEKSGTDYINKIACKDGSNDFLNAFVSSTVKTKNQAIEEILASCSSLKRGKITIDNDYLKAKPLYGNVGKVLLEIPNEDEIMFISKEKLHLIKKSDVISKYVPVMDSSTGLIKVTRQKQVITATTLFNPALTIGINAELISVVNPYLDGIYKIDMIKYKGDTEGNDWLMEVNLINKVQR